MSTGRDYGTMERFVHMHPSLNYISNHNSNAQVEPFWRRHIPREFRRDIPMHGIGDLKTCTKEEDSENLSKYREREKSEDEYDGTSEDDYGRRSSCSLSDETSSMSETELSTVEDECDNFEQKSNTEKAKTPTGHPPNFTYSGKKSKMLTCEDIERELHTENSPADDTLTDLTTGSINLSAMDSCFGESEFSDTPEISALDISGVDLSYENLNSSERTNEGIPSETNTNLETVDIIQQLAEVNGISKRTDNETDTPETIQVVDLVKYSSDYVPSEVDRAVNNEGIACQDLNVHVATLPNTGFQNDVGQPSTEYCPPCYPQDTPCYCPWPAGIPQNYPAIGAFQAPYCFPEKPLHQWDPYQQPYSCCSQNTVSSPFMMPEWPNNAHSFPQTYQPPAQPASYNNAGLLTAEQYYAGQQTPLDPVVAPDYSDGHLNGCIDPSFGAVTGTANTSGENSQYPSLFVSEAGLITALLKHNVFVEMTMDKTIRIVSHELGLVIATNNRGSSNCLYHPHAKLCHEGTTTEVELSDERRVKMSTENILIAKGDKCYRFDYNDVQSAKPDFRDISQDNSVSLLFGASGYGPSLIPQCTELVQNAKFTYKDDGSFRVRINDICITQSNRGDVTVLCGPKFLKMAPLSSYLRIQTHFIDMAVYKNAKMFVRRGTHSLDSNPTNLRVDNGNLEAEFEDGEDIVVVRLPRRTPLRALPRQNKKGGGSRSHRNNRASRVNR